MKIVKMLTLATLLNSIHAMAIEESRPFPINILCGEEKTGTMLSVDMDVMKNQAVLYFENADTPLHISVGPVYGIYSSSSVSFTSTSNRLGKTFTIDASMGEIMRITRFANFKLTLQQNFDQSMVATTLSYSYGTDLDDDNHTGSIEFKEPLICDVQSH